MFSLAVGWYGSATAETVSPSPATARYSEQASGHSSDPTPSAPADIEATPTTVQLDEALAVLEELPDATDQATGYLRSAFGAGWRDPDRNGCDTRNDILARDLADVMFRPGTHDCVVTSGTLLDPYTGMTIHFVRGNVTSEAVQIDHIVPLAWAWRNGAYAWDEKRRVEFANDPDNLLAVDGPTNMSKSDLGPAEWLPPSDAFECHYAAAFVSVLGKYSLSIPRSDRQALVETLHGC
ncbi:HNH endonuclease family protein [Homoserinibacter gongjuensis]|uniref:HNH endonuclease family protein n=1 Tax=Homoserinibacter gongjuensis TaxID=1162968 RepID=UPI0024E10E82|nr:HNH endonuclease family protein [Homoserinibacter gongjuensis]